MVSGVKLILECGKSIQPDGYDDDAARNRRKIGGLSSSGCMLYEPKRFLPCGGGTAPAIPNRRGPGMLELFGEDLDLCPLVQFRKPGILGQPLLLGAFGNQFFDQKIPFDPLFEIGQTHPVLL